MFRTLLVPIDGSPPSRAAVPLAAILGRATGAEVWLLHVLRPGADPKDRALAVQYLAGVAEELEASRLRAQTLVTEGDPALEIPRVARDRRADLILMVTRGRTGRQRARFGSVTERVLQDSPVPVLAFRSDGRVLREVGTLLVPMDTTPGSAVALNLARALGKTAAARLVLTRVLPAAGAAGCRYAEPGGDDGQAQQAHRDLERLTASLRAAGVAAEARVAVGPVAETLVSVAADVEADLIVMSTHALTGPVRSLVGSVADKVVRTAGRPVLLIRQGLGWSPGLQAGYQSTRA